MKTVAGFVNTEGGTLLIGVDPERAVVGLGHDYPLVKPIQAGPSQDEQEGHCVLRADEQLDP